MPSPSIKVLSQLFPIKIKKPYCKDIQHNIFGSKAVFFWILRLYFPVGLRPFTLRPLITQGLPLSACLLFKRGRTNQTLVITITLFKIVL
jgi:hypothetical protein